MIAFDSLFVLRAYKYALRQNTIFTALVNVRVAQIKALKERQNKKFNVTYSRGTDLDGVPLILHAGQSRLFLAA